MREKFRLQQFDCVADLAAVLLENDENNGHGLYFAGEVWRVKAAQDSKHSALCRDRMREHFFRYFASLRGLAANECDGDGTKCYEREKGYCAERTAWISHLMAIDFYQQARETQDVSTKLNRLQSASQFLKTDHDFGGFKLIVPTPVIPEREPFHAHARACSTLANINRTKNAKCVDRKSTQSREVTDVHGQNHTTVKSTDLF